MATPPETSQPSPAAPAREREDEDTEEKDEEAAALPDLDHLTMRDFYDIYEVRGVHVR